MGVAAAAGVRLGAAAAAWLGGVALQLRQPDLWTATAYAALAAAGLLLAAWAGRHGAARLAGVALAAFALTGGHALLQSADALPAALENRELVLTGTVAQLPRVVPDGRRFLFQVESARLDGRAVDVPRTLSLGWYRGWGEDGAGLPEELRAGQRWRFGARLRAPHGTLNPHGFDHELWLFEQGVRAVGSVRASPARPAERLPDAAGFQVERLRQHVRDAIEPARRRPACRGRAGRAGGG